VVRILDHYVTTSYARVLGLAAVALVGIFYISTFLDLSDKVFKGDATWSMLGEYLVFVTPQYFYFVIPLAVLVAALVTIGVLTKNNELVVMKACGISLYRIALPMVVCAIAAGLLLFGLEETILGPSNRRAGRLNDAIRGRVTSSDAINRQWVVGASGEIYHYNFIDSQTHRLLGLSVYEFPDGMERLTRHTYADRASVNPARRRCGTSSRGGLDRSRPPVWRPTCPSARSRRPTGRSTRCRRSPPRPPMPVSWATGSSATTPNGCAPAASTCSIRTWRWRASLPSHSLPSS
jgi:hypothetical protein